VNQIPRWRMVAAVLILVALASLAVLFAPIYVHNLELQNFVSDIAARSNSPSQSDDVLRGWVLDKAYTLHLPVKAGDVRILRSPEGMRIEVRYFVRISFPGYTVDLHFYPGAGSH
jgi:hypothetical protein